MSHCRATHHRGLLWNSSALLRWTTNILQRLLFWMLILLSNRLVLHLLLNFEAFIHGLVRDILLMTRIFGLLSWVWRLRSIPIHIVQHINTGKCLCFTSLWICWNLRAGAKIRQRLEFGILSILRRLLGSVLLMSRRGCWFYRMRLCLEQSFKIHELALKAEVREHNVSSFSHKRHRLEERHPHLLHQIGNDAWCASWNACITMNQNFASTFYSILDKRDAPSEVLHNIHIRHI